MAKVTKKTAASKPAAAKSAAPGTTEEKPKKAKRIAYPTLNVEEGDNGKATTPLDAIPEDYDSKKHLPLRRKDFSDESMWFDMKADEYDGKAAAFRKQAADWRAMGSKADRAKAKRLIAMKAKMAELEAALKAEGIDTDALLGTDEDSDE